MEIEEKLKKLNEFKQTLLDWSASYEDETRLVKLRLYINQNIVWVHQEVVEARCFRTLTIGPPPNVGGLIMQNVDPFAMLFDPPYGIKMTAIVADMIDQTIGVLNMLAPEAIEEASTPKIGYNIERNYAFVAMAIDPDNPELEDVLDAIKEGAVRCGIQAERVDKVQSNDRITDIILDSIKKAEYVIVDITNSQPNVFYEAGFAQGIGKTPIFIAKDGAKLEFDLKDYPVIFFKNLKQLKDDLEARLRALANHKNKTLYQQNQEESNASIVTPAIQLIQDEINKVERKLKRWVYKQHQISAKILNTFLELKRSGNPSITKQNIADKASIPTFQENFSQMISIAKQNHCKIFEEKNGCIEIWEPVSQLVSEYEETILGKNSVNGTSKNP